MGMIPLFKVRMERGVGVAVRDVLYSGFIGQGGKVDEFEEKISHWVGRRTVLAVNSCTSAIHLALRLSGVGIGSEVISTAVTCTATNVPILAAGARIRWADVDARTGCVDAQSIRSKITSRTKAVMVVHWGGRACDLDPILEVCHEYGLTLIEDAAHALGASYRGRPIGSHGDFVCFSFQAIKHLTTGDGGLLSCKSKKDYERGKLLRWYGIRRPANLKRDIREWGYKFHMNDIAATIGLENLKGLALDLRRRRENAEVFSGARNDSSAFWFYPKHVTERQSFIKHMAERGVAVGVVHERNDKYTMFKDSRCSLPGVDAFCESQVNLPVGPWVDAKKAVEAVHCFKGS